MSDDKVRQMLLARVDDLTHRMGELIVEVREVTEQLHPERARSCRNAITMADEVRASPVSPQPAGWAGLSGSCSGSHATRAGGRSPGFPVHPRGPPCAGGPPGGSSRPAGRLASEVPPNVEELHRLVAPCSLRGVTCLGGWGVTGDEPDAIYM
jgi:hypothetical protein